MNRLNRGSSPDAQIAAKRKDFEATDKYALQPRTTETGRFYVVRREWELMFGKPVLNEYAHRVSPWLDSEFARIDFCTRYAKNNPGCVARAEDVIA